MWLGLALSSLFLLPCWSLDFDDPTPEEIKKGLVLPAIPSWGQQARDQNSLRILCVGGSNTERRYPTIGANGTTYLGYVDLLDKFVKEKISNSSYAMNKGVSEWPNVVIIDAVSNTPSHVGDNVLMDFEKFVRSIAFKYKLRGFSSPDFMIYNMPHLRPMYLSSQDNRTDRELFAATYRQNYYQGLFEADTVVNKFAEYYHFPVLSWGEATYDAAVQHYIEHGFTREYPWRYCDDGIHPAPTGGTQFGMEQLLGPFFLSVMKKKRDDEGPLGPRMWSASPVLMEVLGYSSNTHLTNVFTLTDAVVNLNRSEWRRIPMQRDFYCFGSREANATCEMRFNVPETCNRLTCKVKVTFLHSWNASNIGNTTCSLHHHLHHTHSGIKLANITINGQEGANGATIPIETEITGVNNVTQGMYSVKCTNVNEGKLSCMTGLNVNAVVVV